MSITIADQYYLKALDDYGYCYNEVMENLNYALSYDSEHADANYLMGKLYMEQFQKYEQAEEHLVTSMSIDPSNVKTCESMIWLFIRTHRFKEALKLIEFTLKLKGVLIPEILRLKALTYELMKQFDMARIWLINAIQESYDDSYIEFLQAELKRIEMKQQMIQGVRYHLE
ncbi:hypothetical protein [Reichenbachiella versicolor]|uniref:hypothetical protein n=1 Tax=Reichenbachiella versicolor TaxID=1821036 RepID=UPI000D6E23B3|nr:hypothetical protein [Reichenbachiella versicolor]